jgi:hypothetical protein
MAITEQEWAAIFVEVKRQIRANHHESAPEQQVLAEAIEWMRRNGMGDAPTTGIPAIVQLIPSLTKAAILLPVAWPLAVSAGSVEQIKSALGMVFKAVQATGLGPDLVKVLISGTGDSKTMTNVVVWIINALGNKGKTLVALLATLGGILSAVPFDQIVAWYTAHPIFGTFTALTAIAGVFDRVRKIINDVNAAEASAQAAALAVPYFTPAK